MNELASCELIETRFNWSNCYSRGDVLYCFQILITLIEKLVSYRYADGIREEILKQLCQVQNIPFYILSKMKQVKKTQ